MSTSSSPSPSPSASTSRFTLPNTTPSIPITHPTSLAQEQILNFPAFKTWLTTLQHSLSLQTTQPSHPFHSKPYTLRSIDIQSADFFSSGSRLGFLKLRATVTNDESEHLPGAVFMRGGSVAMLIILSPSPSSSNSDSASEQPNYDDPAPSAAPAEEEEAYAILTLQPRLAAGSLNFIELPAGMLDDSGTFAGAAAKEIHEETGLEIQADELLDLTQLSIQSQSQSQSQSPSRGRHEHEHEQHDKDQRDQSTDQVEPHLQQAIYPSPGASDEFIPIFLARKSMSHQQINELKGKLTGLRDHGEKITLKIVPLNQVWKVAARDGKTLAALALYQGLKGEGRI
jgi:8-oxo-dGTP pyrophosphatase MutT (NUDIX family)